MEAVGSVCNPAGDLLMDMLDGLQSLSGKSLVKQEAGARGDDAGPSSLNPDLSAHLSCSWPQRLFLLTVPGCRYSICSHSRNYRHIREASCKASQKAS